jgi:serine/threonine protein phosphatase 1
MLYAIGDIHGQFDLLQSLYASIRKDIEEVGDEHNVIVFLGDYIDRGSQNVQVLQFLMTLRNEPGVEHVFIYGNHEDLFVHALEHQLVPIYNRMWTQNGGQAFLDEVGMDWDYFRITYQWEKYVNWMKTKLDLYYETEDYVFVHGGVDIRIEDMRDQNEESLMWARHMQKDWYRTYHKMVIHGHTPQHDPYVDINRVNVDTSWSYAKHTGQLHLTAVVLPNRRADGEPRFIQAVKPLELKAKYRLKDENEEDS